MFRERYLIFQKGETPHSSPGENGSGKFKAGRKTESDNISKETSGTTNQKESFEQRADTILGKILLKNEHNEPSAFCNIFDHEKYDKDPAIKRLLSFNSFFSNLKPLVEQKLRHGYTFVGTSQYGLAWKWQKEGKVEEELNPVFEKSIESGKYASLKWAHFIKSSAEEYYKKAIAHREWEKLSGSEKARIYVRHNIIPYIKQKRPDLSLDDNKLWGSFLIAEEVLPILTAGYGNGKGNEYHFEETKDGFVLKSYQGGIFAVDNQFFKLDQYDKNLDPIGVQSKKTHGDDEGMISDEDTIDKFESIGNEREVISSIKKRKYADELKILSEIGAYGSQSEKLSQIKKGMDGFVGKREEFKSVNDNVKTLVSYIENELATGQYKSSEDIEALMKTAKNSELGSLIVIAMKNLSSGEHDPESQAALEVYWGYLDLIGPILSPGLSNSH